MKRIYTNANNQPLPGESLKTYSSRLNNGSHVSLDEAKFTNEVPVPISLDWLKDLSPLDRLLYWIEEREKIRLAKEAGKPKPWTGNPILQQHRFCNVRRMDDKVSQWLMKYWYTPNFNHKNMLIACVLARHFNNPHTLMVIGFPKLWNPKKTKESIREIHKTETVFNGAYIVNGGKGNYQDKISYVIDGVVGGIIDNQPQLNYNSMQESTEELGQCYGIGSFMAGQIVADLRWAVEGSWADKDTWAAVGPGSRRGINRLYLRDKDMGLSQDDFLEDFIPYVECCKECLPESITSRLEAIDYQNCLCEYDKFSRGLFGEGRIKQSYDGEA